MRDALLLPFPTCALVAALMGKLQRMHFIIRSCSTLLKCQSTARTTLGVVESSGRLLESSAPSYVLQGNTKVATAPCLLQQLNQQLRDEAQAEDREYHGSLTVLIDISFELLRPYQDLRKNNLRDLSLTEAFWLLSGETEHTLKPGRRVQATIQGLSAMAAFCTLPDIRDMEAVISSSDISSSGEVRPDSRLRRGDTVPARSANQSLLYRPNNPCLLLVSAQLTTACLSV